MYRTLEIPLMVCLGVIGAMVIIMVVVAIRNPISVVVDSGEMSSTITVGKGLYEAMQVCERNGGVTSLQGRDWYIELSCWVDGDATYELDDYHWITEKKIKLK